MQNTKCQQCDAPAEVHVMELVSGEKIQRHLCASCAQAILGTTKHGGLPINRLVDAMLSEAVRENVDVMKVQPTIDSIHVRFQIGMELIERDRIPLRFKEALVKRFGEIANEPQLGGADVSAEAHLTINDRDVNLRLSSEASNPHAVTVMFSTAQ